MAVFRPPWWAWLMAAAGLCLFLTLAHWQYQRGQARATLIEQRERAAQTTPFEWGQTTPGIIGRRYRVRGEWLADRQLLHDNQTQDGRPGYHLWTAIDEGPQWPLVLVNRGWVPLPATRDALPDVALDDPGAAVTGIWSPLPRPGIELETDACTEDGWPRRVDYPDVAELSCIFGRPVRDGVLLLDADAANGAVRTWTALGLPPERHYGYAVQWLALAITTVVLFVALNWKKLG